MYELKRGHNEWLITKKEKRGSYIVCTMFDYDQKAERLAKKIISAMNKTLKVDYSARRHTNTENGESYWNDNGAYSKEYSNLYSKLVPSSGICKTLNGELLRAISNINHDYYNNGNCNANEDNKTLRNDFNNYVKLIKSNIPEAQESCLKVERIILDDCYGEKKQYQIYNTLFDSVMYYVLNSKDLDVPNWYKNFQY